MSTIKFTDVLACSSEDSVHRAENLMRSGKWLSKANDNNIEVVFKMEKEHVISFIDIGNHGTLSIEVLVSHSLRTKGDFFPLIPKCMLMSVAESKQYVKIKQVHMFKKDQMLSSTRDQTWDILKIICSQPYLRLKQSFGLSFFTVKSSSTLSPTVVAPSAKHHADIITTPTNNKSKLKNLFEIKSQTTPPEEKTPTLKLSDTPSLSTPDTVKGSAKKLFTPSSTKTLKIFSPAAKAQFLGEIECFLKDMNFREVVKKNKAIKVSDLREKLEKQRGLALSRFQKKLFLETIKGIMEENEESENLNPENPIDKAKGQKLKDLPIFESPPDKRPPPQPQDNPPRIKLTLQQKNVALDVSCRYCKAKIPRKVHAIHEKICAPSADTLDTGKNEDAPTTTLDDTNIGPLIEDVENEQPPNKKLRHRNSLCFDADDDDNDGVIKYTKKKFSNTKLFANALQSVSVKSSNLPNDKNIENVSKINTMASNGAGDRLNNRTEYIAEIPKLNNSPNNFGARGNYSPWMQKPNSKKTISPNASINKMNILQNSRSISNENTLRMSTTSLPNGLQSLEEKANKLLNGTHQSRQAQKPTSFSNPKTHPENGLISPRISYSPSVKKTPKRSFLSPLSADSKYFENLSKALTTNSNDLLAETSGSTSTVFGKTLNNNSTIYNSSKSLRTCSVSKIDLTTTINDHTHNLVRKIPNTATVKAATNMGKKTVISDDLQECPICHNMISVYKIGLHAATCTGKKPDNPSPKGIWQSKNNGGQSAKPLEIVDDIPITVSDPVLPTSSESDSVFKTEFTLCPICSIKVNTDIIQFHVNQCLDALS